MRKSFQAIRGMHDVLPERSRYFAGLESRAQALLASYGYEQIRLPVVESTELFKRTLGETTDVVEKEMYSFIDRSGDGLTLRPEGTAGCVRAAIEHGMTRGQLCRWWYSGPMFRHERPQKGRYRQFHQIGVEVFGMPGPDIDAELILITRRLWRILGVRGLVLELNTLGSPEARGAYRDKLVDYLSSQFDRLDDDSRRRLHSNPLRVLDSKHPAMQTVIAGAPVLRDHVDEASRRHFEHLLALLDASGLTYRVNPRLVRGLDYYTKTVFEWTTDRLGAQGTVCAGGRYDGLVGQLGGPPTAAAGFALGMDRVVTLMEQDAPLPAGGADLYFAVAGDQAARVGTVWAEQLRDVQPTLAIVVDCGGGGFKAQLKRADRSGAVYALIVGDEEAGRGQIGVKALRGDQTQRCWPWPRLLAVLAEWAGGDLGQTLNPHP